MGCFLHTMVARDAPRNYEGQRNGDSTVCTIIRSTTTIFLSLLFMQS